MSRSSDEGNLRTVLELLSDLKNGRISPDSLSQQERLACTECLDMKGATVYEIASILKRGERTIYRYKRMIKKRNRLRCDSKFSSIQLGQVDRDVSLCIQHLRRISEDPQATIQDRIAAQREIGRVIIERVKFFQSSGLIPYHKAKPNEVPQDIEDWITRMMNFYKLEDGTRKALLNIKIQEIRDRIDELRSDEPETETGEGDVEEAG